MARIEGWSEEATEAPPSRTFTGQQTATQTGLQKPPSDVCPDIVSRIIKHDMLYSLRVVDNEESSPEQTKFEYIGDKSFWRKTRNGTVADLTQHAPNLPR